MRASLSRLHQEHGLGAEHDSQGNPWKSGAATEVQEARAISKPGPDGISASQGIEDVASRDNRGRGVGNQIQAGRPGLKFIGVRGEGVEFGVSQCDSQLEGGRRNQFDELLP